MTEIKRDLSPSGFAWRVRSQERKSFVRRPPFATFYWAPMNACSGRNFARAGRPLDCGTPRRPPAICYVRSTSTPAVRRRDQAPSDAARSRAFFAR